MWELGANAAFTAGLLPELGRPCLGRWHRARAPLTAGCSLWGPDKRPLTSHDDLDTEEMVALTQGVCLAI